MHTLAAALPTWKDRQPDVILHAGRFYRITVERLAPHEADAAVKDTLKESRHADL